MKSEYCGYCFFNNVAVAASEALKSGLARKILIVDFDVHHGQGTQQLVYDNPKYAFYMYRLSNAFWAIRTDWNP
jgi:histone deacetylase 6